MMLKTILFSKRAGVAVGVLVAYLATNPDQIVALGVPMAWQVRIVALLGLATKIWDTLKAHPA